MYNENHIGLSEDEVEYNHGKANMEDLKVKYEEGPLQSKIIEDLVDEKKNINYQELHQFFNQELKELYKRTKGTNMLDLADIRYTAMINLIYEIMPSLKEEGSGTKTMAQMKEKHPNMDMFPDICSPQYISP